MYTLAQFNFNKKSFQAQKICKSSNKFVWYQRQILKSFIFKCWKWFSLEILAWMWDWMKKSFYPFSKIFVANLPEGIYKIFNCWLCFIYKTLKNKCTIIFSEIFTQFKFYRRFELDGSSKKFHVNKFDVNIISYSS